MNGHTHANEVTTVASSLPPQAYEPAMTGDLAYALDQMAIRGRVALEPLTSSHDDEARQLLNYYAKAVVPVRYAAVDAWLTRVARSVNRPPSQGEICHARSFGHGDLRGFVSSGVDA